MTTSLFEMANLSKKITGLPFIVWVSVGHGEGEKKLPHASRVKVEVEGKRYPFSIQDPAIKVKTHPFSSKEIEKICQWIKDHQKDLQAHWDKKLTADELILRLMK